MPDATIKTQLSYRGELSDAYAYAYKIGITTMPTLQKANLKGNLLRSHMAKMMVIYATKVLNLEPDTTKICSFSDIGKEPKELR